MIWNRILVPLGLLAMVTYHLWLRHRIIWHPTTTVIGISRRIWRLAQSKPSSLSKSFDSPDVEEQHNGVHAVSIDVDHAQLTDRGVGDQRRRRPARATRASSGWPSSSSPSCSTCGRHGTIATRAFL